MSLGNISKRFFTISLLLSIFAVQALVAQYGTLKGRVFDKDTKEELPGANIVFKGTSMGMSTDLNGEFTIYNVPMGLQTVTVSYLGYVTINVPIEIIEDETVKQDFLLTPTALEGETVIVTAQAQGQMQAINQQLSSNKIVSVVSEAKIQELPDFNAAAAIGRLPGVSVIQSSGEASKVVIRGLSPQFNQISVGGISVASTGSSQIGLTSAMGGSAVNNDRSVDLTMVTPYMIKSIEVFKTLTPDMNANAIGGVVNMELREAPSGLHGDVLYQSGYTDKTESYGNYRSVISLSNRFFDDQLGVYILGNVEAYDRNADNMTADYETAGSVIGPSGYRPVRVTNVTLNRHVENRKRYGGNLILDYKLPNGTLKSVNMFSRLNSFAREYNTTFAYNDPTNQPVNYRYDERDGTTDLAVNSLELKNDFGFFSVALKAANSYSRNNLPHAPAFTFSQNRGHTVNANDTMKVPEELVLKRNLLSDTTILLQNSALFKSDYRENDQIYKADFKIPINVGSIISGSFKFGGEYSYNLHVNDQNTPYIAINRGTGSDPNDINIQVVDSIRRYYPNLQLASNGRVMGSNFRSGDSKLYNSFLSDRFGAVTWALDPGVMNWIIDYVAGNPYLVAPVTTGGWFNGNYQKLPNDYKYIERYYAAYLMSEFNIGSDLSVVGGARFEQDKGLYEAYILKDERNTLSQPFTRVTAYPQNHNWLPMVQAKYNIFDWVDVRYSYAQTLARPAYTQLSPAFSITSDNPTVFGGNPKLKPAKAYNQDFVLTFHSNNIGLLSVGGFYKEIEDFIYRTTYQLYSKAIYDRFGITGLDSTSMYAGFGIQDGNRINTFINSRFTAYVRGVETDFQHRLWYLPFPFDGVVLGINYTHIWSKLAYPVYRVIGRQGRITWYSKDSTQTLRLVDQPDDILNSYVGYDYRGFSARLSFLFQGNALNTVGEFRETDASTLDYYRIDASVRQMLPWDGLQLFLEISNLNGEINRARQESIHGFRSQNHYGLVANVGLRYNL